MGCVHAVIAFAVLCIFGQWIALMFVNAREGKILAASVPHRQQPVLYSTGLCQCGAVYDTGTWVFQAGCYCRSMRDGSPFLCGILPGACVWIYSSVHPPASGLDRRGPVSYTGLPPCDEESEPAFLRQEQVLRRCTVIGKQKESKIKKLRQKIR